MIEFVGRIVPETTEVLFAASRKADVKGQRRRIRLIGNGQLVESLQVKCPSWLSGKVHGTSSESFHLDLEVVEPPRASAADGLVVLESADGKPLATLRALVFAMEGTSP